ncbi:hypothetical protein A2716_03470 [candidate division WWE3 bacterium RIFCSPHIGHO2_01_FULL_40_23]|uniref:Sortase n=1 Tax=candidate division WWE3 bacterium RIFCSPLOWO2_01_FULL_41_18 TaxID=1802625 RepID=A0A1F4VCT2_UNCKA|nr:MAG: hypothetical protein A2716_03470 [candidate division WWE3 bacterium RIFCSPHIGHO2_01_FULL_40_23]OGC54939.1 MAG: hypothetical protein A3A78_03080 [candidate division WWE3 bacterium RIFCSPLOWO2_01_FULL_41_18]
MSENQTLFSFIKEAFTKDLKGIILVFLIPIVMLLGVFIFAGYLIETQIKTSTYAKGAVLPKTLIFREEKDVPRRIVIPKISVDLVVKGARVDQGTWITFDNFASYGIGTSFLNDKTGNTVIFAHAKDALFSRLDNLNKNDFVYVSSDKEWYRFEVYKKIYVYPYEIDFLKEDYGKALVLFTCYGPEDEKRVVVISRFKDKDEYTPGN